MHLKPVSHQFKRKLTKIMHQEYPEYRKLKRSRSRSRSSSKSDEKSRNRKKHRSRSRSAKKEKRSRHETRVGSKERSGSVPRKSVSNEEFRRSASPKPGD